MIAGALTEAASTSDASTMAGALVVLALLAVGVVWAWLTQDRHPDDESLERFRREVDGLARARSMGDHPAKGDRS
jgi:hypothetical protein